MIDLYRVNLNLLVALDVLLTEQNVTRAAKKLSITQSAMSNNLQQLRTIFKDELLIRESKNMIMTSSAKALHPKIHSVLHEVNSIISNGQPFDPETSARVFRIALSDYLSSTLLPRVLQKIQKKAPNIKLCIKGLTSIDSSEGLENGEYDLMIGKILNGKLSIQKRVLFKDEIVAIVNKNNILAKKKKITVDDFLSQKHIGCTGSNNKPSFIDESLNSINKKRDLRMEIPFFIPMFKIIEESDNLIATTPKVIAEFHQTNYSYVIKSLPFKTKSIEYSMAWHSSVDNDAGHCWLRQQFNSL